MVNLPRTIGIAAKNWKFRTLFNRGISLAIMICLYISFEQAIS